MRGSHRERERQIRHPAQPSARRPQTIIARRGGRRGCSDSHSPSLRRRRSRRWASDIAPSGRTAWPRPPSCDLALSARHRCSGKPQTRHFEFSHHPPPPLQYSPTLLSFHPDLQQPAGCFPESSRYRLHISGIMWTLFHWQMQRRKSAPFKNYIISTVEPVKGRGHTIIFELQCIKLSINSLEPKKSLALCPVCPKEESLFLCKHAFLSVSPPSTPS